MRSLKKILSPTGEALLSARKAAKRLACTPDYIGKLCREGKLKGNRIDNVWFVDRNSLAEFEKQRSQARLARSRELSDQRKLENKKHQELQREALLSTRQVAKRLQCAPDYVGKLCREGKLDGVRIQNAWFVDEPSIVRFEEERTAARSARSQELSDQRRVEGRAYKNLKPSFVAHWFRGGVGAALGAAVLLAAVALAGSAALSGRGVVLRGGSALSASLGQLQSPFFGTYPTTVKVPAGPGGAFASNFFSDVFGFFFPAKKPEYAQSTPPAPSTGSGPAASTPPAAAVPVQKIAVAPQPPSVVQHNTYPVIERTVEHTTVVSGITGDLLATKLSELKNALQAQLSQLQNPGNGSVLNNFDIAQHTSTPVLTDAVPRPSRFSVTRMAVSRVVRVMVARRMVCPLRRETNLHRVKVARQAFQRREALERLAHLLQRSFAVRNDVRAPDEIIPP